MDVINLSTDNEDRLVPYFFLSEKELRGQKLFMAESPNVIERALNSGIQPVYALCNSNFSQRNFDTLFNRYPDLPIISTSDEVLSRLIGFHISRGVMCLMRRPDAIEGEELLRNAKRVCVLYDICDATNVGLIFRSAAALGFDAVILSISTCDPLNRRSLRTSMGTVFQIPWGYCSNVMVLLREKNFVTVCGALTPDSGSLAKFLPDKSEKYAVIFGSEGYGLPTAVIKSCNHALCIPMKEHVDSLNVGAAASIFLWHFRP